MIINLQKYLGLDTPIMTAQIFFEIEQNVIIIFGTFFLYSIHCTTS